MTHPVFVADRASCRRYLEDGKNNGTQEFQNIQDIHYGSAMVKADTDSKEKCLVISEKCIEDLNKEYSTTIPYRLDALIEATDHKALQDNLTEAEELMKLASIYLFVTHRPTHIIVDDQKLYDELVGLAKKENPEPDIKIVMLGACKDILKGYHHFNPTRS